MTDDGFESAWFALENYLSGLPTHQRALARDRMVRRIRHPELGGNPQSAPPPPPPSTGDCHASRVSRLCVCGAKRSSHDPLTGERDTCDGYFPAP